MPVRLALDTLGAKIYQLDRLRPRNDHPNPPPAKTLPIGSATRYLLNNAHREAEQLGHHRVDSLHLLLALLYKDSTATAAALEQAGVAFYGLRQSLTTPGSLSKGLGRRPLRSLDGDVRVSPVVAVL